MKITPDMVYHMKALKKEGLPYFEIAKAFFTSKENVKYHTSPKYRKSQMENTRNRWLNLSDEGKKQLYSDRKEYNKHYCYNKYHTDPEFRKKMITANVKLHKLNYYKWKKQGLCVICGGKRIPKRWLTCKRCRRKEKYRRDRYRRKLKLKY